MSKLNEALAFQKKKKEDVDMDVAETCQLKPFKEDHRNTHHEGGTHGEQGSDDEEEDGHQRGQGVRCQQ